MRVIGSLHYKIHSDYGENEDTQRTIRHKSSFIFLNKYGCGRYLPLRMPS